jgi:predicted RNA-binding protein with PIN domain
MTFLIDAYNLMHAVGYLSKTTPKNRMESSRRRLLDWLGDNARTRPGDRFQVVFDAKAMPSPLADRVHRGIHVHHSFQESADDVLIRLLNESKPGTATLVSNDNEIQAAARRNRCAVMTCLEFVDWLIAPVAKKKSDLVETEKPENVLDEQELLEVFSKANKKRIHGKAQQ